MSSLPRRSHNREVWRAPTYRPSPAHCRLPAAPTETGLLAPTPRHHKNPMHDCKNTDVNLSASCPHLWEHISPIAVHRVFLYPWTTFTRALSLSIASMSTLPLALSAPWRHQVSLPSPHTAAPCPCTPPPQRTDSRPSHASLALRPAVQGLRAPLGQGPPPPCAWPRTPAPGWRRTAAAWSTRSPADPSPWHSRRLHEQELLDRQPASFRKEQEESPH